MTIHIFRRSFYLAGLPRFQMAMLAAR